MSISSTQTFKQPAKIVQLFSSENARQSASLAKVYAIPIQTQQLLHQTIPQKPFSWLAVIFTIFAHIATIYMLLVFHAPEKAEVLPVKPMMVSLIAPPAPEPEIVPIVEPPKPVVQPKPIVKKVVEKIKPIEQPAERLVEAAVEQPIIEETPVAPEAPVKVAEVVKAPPVAEPIVEDKIEQPRFGVSYLNNPAPDYPPLSRRLGEEGRVLMKVLVSVDGSASEVALENSSGSDRLDKAAISAVKRWRFIPAKRNNQPFSAYVLVPIKFSLDS
jgi:protein TonB